MINGPDIDSRRRAVAQQWRQLRDDAREMAGHPAVPDEATLRTAWAEVRRTEFSESQPTESDALWLGAILDPTLVSGCTCILMAVLSGMALGTLNRALAQAETQLDENAETAPRQG